MDRELAAERTGNPGVLNTTFPTESMKKRTKPLPYATPQSLAFVVALVAERETPQHLLLPLALRQFRAMIAEGWPVGVAGGETLNRI
jgi:hypothetical protein